MKLRFRTPLFAGLLCLSLAACDSAKTNIVEKDPITKPGDDHDHGSHEGHGRLLVINASNPEAAVYDLEDGSLLDTLALSSVPRAVYASGGYRYGVLSGNASDPIRFIDGGLWQEEHLDHMDVYEEAPALLDYNLAGTNPTHFVSHEGQLAIFFDGNASPLTPARVAVLSDADIASPSSIEFDVNMHGVALPRGDTVFVSWRRDNTETTSNIPTTPASNPLPDQVAVYHLHDGAYEQEQILDVTCPDLHGAAQNENYIIFGCSDGVLLVHEHDGEFEAEKILNSEEVAEGLRISSIYGHEHSEQFIGLARAHGGTGVQWFVIDPAERKMEVIDWQPVGNTQVVGRGFSFKAEQFLVLDNQGYLTVLEPHEHDGETHWEFAERLDITEEDIADLPTGTNFSLTVSQNGHTAYVSDPIAQHVVVVDLEEGEIVDEIETDFAPASLVWLGIREVHEH